MFGPITARRPDDAVHHRTARSRSDGGYTLIELMIAFALLLTLFAVAANVLTTYLTVSNTVISSYNSTDQLLPSSIIIQRLIRSEVEPAPAPTTATTCAAVNAPCPAFLTGSVGTYSMTFYANIGDPNGPAMIVMAEGPASQCSGCNFSTSDFTVTQYAACPALATRSATCPVNSGCPFLASSTNTCSWSSSGKVLVDVNNVVNGDTPVPNTTSPPITAATPIFTYNTLNQYSAVYIPGAGGTASASTGLLPAFNTCSAPTTDVS
jgi:hypothetical protein